MRLGMGSVLGVQCSGKRQGMRRLEGKREEREGKSWEGVLLEGKGKVTRSKNLGKQGVKGTMANSVKLTGRKKEIRFLRKVRS